MSANEAKWKANQEKVAFLKQFPGLLGSWDEATGRTVTSVTAIEQSDAKVLIFDNGTFAIVPPPAPEPKQLRDGIEAAEARLRDLYPEAYREYEALAQRDREATRTARMENILGAIHNNLDDIPELKDRIRSLVKQWNS
ncbi:MAG: hypothetical protein F4X63_09570 [Nitrospira sp. SB0662_bin_26]|nr:hypothetical protein [Nitrospira sp. SB0662_bin_26]